MTHASSLRDSPRRDCASTPRGESHLYPPQLRCGFTLAELVVAIALLTVGLGALAGTSSYLLSETASSRRAERGANLARTRLELLRLGPCATVSGTALAHGLTERWTVSTLDRSAVTAVRISYSERGREIVQHYQSAFPC